MMVNRIHPDTSREKSKTNDHSIAGSSGFAHRTGSSHKRSDSNVSDDVIAYLANAHENRRARQVIEWERMRQHRA
jgi:hypothetical protein